MYLKSIEVHGFKSFANKIVFEFHTVITALFFFESVGSQLFIILFSSIKRRKQYNR